MLVSFYTSRILLNVIGIKDYGLYNVVGGIVFFFAFLNTAMAAATQRFITFELGKKLTDKLKLKQIFSISVSAHAAIAVVMILLAETLGVWLLNSQIQVPEGRVAAAHWVLQFSVFSLCFDVLSVPYMASVIAYEKMTLYALVNIVESLLKLAVIIALQYLYWDKLILFAALMFLTKVCIFMIYKTTCTRKFEMCHYVFTLDKSIFFNLFSFTGWSLLGQMSIVAVNQGTNILINIFHTVVANASMGIAGQVNTALNNLVSNFQTAFQPQITKSYANNDLELIQLLIYRSSKISFYLLYIVSIPIMFNINEILVWWLNIVPEYTVTFCILIIVGSLINSLSGPLWMSIFSTGKIKIYQIAISLIYLSDILLVYIFFKLGYSPIWAMIVKMIINMIVLVARMYFAGRLVERFSCGYFFKKSLQPVLFVVFSSLCIIYPVHVFYFKGSFCINVLFSLLVVAMSIYIFGIDREERDIFNSIVKTKFLRQ